MRTDPTRGISGMRPVRDDHDERTFVGHDGRSPESIRRPGIADLVALELGIPSFDECSQPERQRKAGSEPAEITELVLSTHRRKQQPPSPAGTPQPASLTGCEARPIEPQRMAYHARRVR